MHKAVRIARDLISIPSVNPMGKNLTGDVYSEKNVVDYIKTYLQGIGMECETIGSDPVHPNLLARLDLGKKETILLEAHMDTVSHENMIIDPFDPVITDGLLYGRGSCDTKASLAVYLYALGEMINKTNSLKRNVLLACVRDEEFCFTGAKEMVAASLKTDFAIVGEPTSLNIIYGHKGVCRFFISTQGVSCHAALPWLGENAIYKMGKILEGIESYSKHLLGLPNPDLGPATINAGRIFGGETVNTVPSSCSVEIDHRLLPGMNFESIVERLGPYLGDKNGYIIHHPYLEALGAWNPSDSVSCQELQAACKAAGIDPILQTAPYATDASIYHSAGIPCVVFGPGSIQLAHTSNENVPIKEIEKACEIIVKLLSE